MTTVYQMLRFLQALGWRQKMRIGQMRLLEHTDRPGVNIILKGKPSARVDAESVQDIYRKAGFEGGSR